MKSASSGWVVPDTPAGSGMPTADRLATWGLLAGGVGLLVIVVGCSEAPRANPQNYQVRRIRSVTQSQAFATAEATLREYDFRIKEANPERGVITSMPKVQTVEGGTGRLRDATLRLPNRVRRIATLEVVPGGDSVSLMCRVLLERQDTIDHHTFRGEHARGDVPSGTPIDEEGSVTTEQNEVWTRLPRDRELERQLIAAWLERLGRVRPADSSSAPADAQ